MGDLLRIEECNKKECEEVYKKDRFERVCKDMSKQPKIVWEELNKALGRPQDHIRIPARVNSSVLRCIAHVTCTVH